MDSNFAHRRVRLTSGLQRTPREHCLEIENERRGFVDPQRWASRFQAGRREGCPHGCPSQLPHHRTWGSAYGGSWQSLRMETATLSLPRLRRLSGGNNLASHGQSGFLGTHTVPAEALTGSSVVRETSPLMSMVLSVCDEGLGEGADLLGERLSRLEECSVSPESRTRAVSVFGQQPEHPYMKERIPRKQACPTGARRKQIQLTQGLEQINLHAALVVSDIYGETGLRIIEAILNGQYDPKEMVKLRDQRCKKSSVTEMEAALKGHYTQELLFVLGQTIDGWKFCQKQLELCDRQIAKALAALPTAKPRPAEVKVPPKAVPVDPAAAEKAKRPKRPRGNNQATVDFREALRRVCGVDLMRICGLNVLSVLTLIAEIGPDMRHWRSEKAFSSWLGLCLGTKISGGKVLSRRTRHVVNRAATILRLAAMAAGRTDTWIGRFYRRKQSHLGAPKAITATAHKLACVIYHMLKYQEEFLPIDVALHDLQAQERRLRHLHTEAQKLGYQVVEIQSAA